MTREKHVLPEPANAMLDAPGEAVPYEQRLVTSRRWGLEEGSRYFEGQSEVHVALRAVCLRLNELNVPYAVIGGMALFYHGFPRFTSDVDLLTTKEGLRIIHDRLEGLGYRPPFEGSKHLRDVVNGVKIEFLTQGEYPGDGKPKPVAFPDPALVSEVEDQIRYINLPALIELKLASGMTGAARLKDFADVIELIRRRRLPRNFADQLNPYVQDKFLELWADVPRRYMLPVRVGSNSSEIRTIDDLIRAIPATQEKLVAMADAGVHLDQKSSVREGYVLLITDDPQVAARFGFSDEDDL